MPFSLDWFAQHWEIVTGLCVVISWVLGFLMGLWKSKAEIGMLKLQKQKLEYDVQVQSCVQVLCIRSSISKQIAGTHDVTFTETEMRDWTRRGRLDSYVSEALRNLAKEGYAGETDRPGHWWINWSNSPKTHS